MFEWSIQAEEGASRAGEFNTPTVCSMPVFAPVAQATVVLTPAQLRELGATLVLQHLSPFLHPATISGSDGRLARVHAVMDRADDPQFQVFRS